MAPHGARHFWEVFILLWATHLFLPSAGAKSVTLTWDIVEGATQYELELSRGDTVLEHQIVDGSMRQWVGTVPAGIYRYRVRGFGREHSQGEWSQRAWVVVKPPSPALVLPHDGQEFGLNQNIFLQWKQTDGSREINFDLQIRLDKKEVRTYQPGTSQEWVLSHSLPGNYQWRVRPALPRPSDRDFPAGFLEENLKGPWTSWSAFHVAASRVAPPSPLPLSKAASSTPSPATPMAQEQAARSELIKSTAKPPQGTPPPPHYVDAPRVYKVPSLWVRLEAGYVDFYMRSAAGSFTLPRAKLGMPAPQLAVGLALRDKLHLVASASEFDLMSAGPGPTLPTYFFTLALSSRRELRPALWWHVQGGLEAREFYVYDLVGPSFSFEALPFGVMGAHLGSALEKIWKEGLWRMCFYAHYFLPQTLLGPPYASTLAFTGESLLNFHVGLRSSWFPGRHGGVFLDLQYRNAGVVANDYGAALPSAFGGGANPTSPLSSGFVQWSAYLAQIGLELNF